MIKITKTISITSGTGPFTHYWDVPSCVSVESSVINDDNNIIATLGFEDSSCFDGLPTNDQGSYVTLHVVSSDGCDRAFEILIQNPCTSFDTQTPTIQVTGTDPFVLEAIPVGGSGPFTYTWIYDELIFEPRGSSPNSGESVTGQSIIELGLTDVSLIGASSETVQVVIKDANGCSITRGVQISIDYPTAGDILQQAECIAQGSTQIKTTGPFFLDVTEANYPIDWSTLEVWEEGDLNANDYEVTNYGDGRIEIQLDSSVEAVIPFKYEVRDEAGFNTNVGDMTINPSDCDDVAPINIMSLCTSLDCDGLEIGHTYRFNLEEYILSASGVNWDTFSFSTLEGQVANEQDTNSFGTFTVGINSNNALIRFTNDHYLEVTVFSTDPFSEQIAFSIEDDLGNKVHNIDHPYTLTLFCSDIPYAVNDYICTECDEPVTFNPLTNDIFDDIPLDPNSLTITSSLPDAMTEGSLTIDSSTGTMTFTPVSGFTGTVTVTYTVDDANSTTTNEGTITIEVYCIGTISFTDGETGGSGGDPIEICGDPQPSLDTSEDISSYISGQAAGTRVYFAGYNSDPNSAIPLTSGTFALDGDSAQEYDPGQLLYDGVVTDINFNGSEVGTYVFELRYGEGDCADIDYIYFEVTGNACP